METVQVPIHIAVVAFSNSVILIMYLSPGTSCPFICSARRSSVVRDSLIQFSIWVRLIISAYWKHLPEVLIFGGWNPLIAADVCPARSYRNVSVRGSLCVHLEKWGGWQHEGLYWEMMDLCWMGAAQMESSRWSGLGAARPRPSRRCSVFPSSSPHVDKRCFSCGTNCFPCGSRGSQADTYWFLCREGW